jgi:hypothetical protein
VISIDWFTSKNGEHILAVGLEKMIQIYTKSRTSYVCEWVCISTVKLEEEYPLLTLGWLPSGSILVSTIANTRIYCAFTETGLNQSSDVCDLQGIGPNDQLFELTAEKSGRIKDHDPSLLIQFSILGKDDLVKFNLSLLYRFVKLAVVSKTKIKKLPLTLWKLLEEQQSAVSNVNYEDLFGTLDDSALDELGVFSTPHLEYLKQHLPESGLYNFEELISFMEAFEKVESYRKVLDHNGFRYCLSALYHLNRDHKYDLHSKDFTWAYFSESHVTLLSIISDFLDGRVMWKDAKNLGFGWWLSDPTFMKDTFENIARNQYRGIDGQNDPVDCSLYYLALKKKNVLLGLWKLAHSHPEQGKMIKFLSNDFNEDRWKETALKNAYALLGKQRYDYAAAFFLLAGNLRDAVGICIKHLDDPQLAILICRINEGENGPILNDLIKKQLLPGACENGDRWLSVILWTLVNNRENAFYSITVIIF